MIRQQNCVDYALCIPVKTVSKVALDSQLQPERAPNRKGATIYGYHPGSRRGSRETSKTSSRLSSKLLADIRHSRSNFLAASCVFIIETICGTEKSGKLILAGKRRVKPVLTSPSASIFSVKA